MEGLCLTKEELKGEKNSLSLTKKSLNSASPGSGSNLFSKKTFKKAESLKSRKLIKALFSNQGEAIKAYPIILLWVKAGLDSDYPAQVAFSVPARNFKRAVDRNLLKRQMRESYRLNKHILYEQLSKQKLQIACLFIYTGHKKSDFNLINDKIILTLKTLAERITAAPPDKAIQD